MKSLIRGLSVGLIGLVLATHSGFGHLRESIEICAYACDLRPSVIFADCGGPPRGV